MTGYAVEAVMLIDVIEREGIGAVAEVDLGSRGNDHQSLAQLGAMAREIVLGIGSRLPRTPPGHEAMSAELAASGRVILERPRCASEPARRARGRRSKGARAGLRGDARSRQYAAGMALRALYTDLDGTLLGRGGSLFAMPRATSPATRRCCSKRATGPAWRSSSCRAGARRRCTATRA